MVKEYYIIKMEEKQEQKVNEQQAQNIEEKKEQKDLLLKYQGGIASNPDLGEEVGDILIDSLNAKMSLMDEMKRLVKKGNKKNLVDKGTGINEYRNDNENEEEEDENQDQKE